MPRFKIIKKDSSEFDFASKNETLDVSAQLSLSPKILFDTTIIKANQADGGVEVGDRFLKLRTIDISANFDHSGDTDALLNELFDAVYKIKYFVDIQANRRILCAPDKNISLKTKPGAGKKFGTIQIKLIALDALWESVTATTGAGTLRENTPFTFRPTIAGYAQTGIIYKINPNATKQNATITIRDNNNIKHTGINIPTMIVTGGGGSNTATVPTICEIDNENGKLYLYQNATNKGLTRNSLISRDSTFFKNPSGLQNIEILTNFAGVLNWEYRSKFFI